MKILLALEDSDYSTQAFKSVLGRTWPEQSEFKIINVLEPFHGYDGKRTFPGTVGRIAKAEQELYAGRRNQVAAKVDELGSRFGPNSVSGEVLTGEVRETILSTAKKWDADLIVMGSHGRRGFSRLLLGSVAEGVAEKAECSVEIVKNSKS